jgi:hypothetical protein
MTKDKEERETINSPFYWEHSNDEDNLLIEDDRPYVVVKKREKSY